MLIIIKIKTYSFSNPIASVATTALFVNNKRFIESYICVPISGSH